MPVRNNAFRQDAPDAADPSKSRPRGTSCRKAHGEYHNGEALATPGKKKSNFARPRQSNFAHSKSLTLRVGQHEKFSTLCRWRGFGRIITLNSSIVLVWFCGFCQIVWFGSQMARRRVFQQPRVLKMLFFLYLLFTYFVLARLTQQGTIHSLGNCPGASSYFLRADIFSIPRTERSVLKNA